MVYQGSKNRFARELIPIIQSYITEDTKGYIEPFVGGANVIDKIEHHNKIGYDVHKYLIALLNYTKDNHESLPTFITEEEYHKVKNNKDDYEDWYVGLVGFGATFGTKWFGGYARSKPSDKVQRVHSTERINNIKKQAPNLKNIKFEVKDYTNINPQKFSGGGYLFYCDPPYKGTTRYSVSKFDYDYFYDWCRELSKNNTVLVSEYHMPEDFTCIWEKKTKVSLNAERKQGSDRTEKLYILKNQLNTY